LGQIGAKLGQVGAKWGPGRGQERPSWGQVGAKLAQVGAKLGDLAHLGAILVPSWCHLGATLAYLAQSSPIFAITWLVLAPSWPNFTPKFEFEGENRFPDRPKIIDFHCFFCVFFDFRLFQMSTFRPTWVASGHHFRSIRGVLGRLGDVNGAKMGPRRAKIAPR